MQHKYLKSTRWLPLLILITSCIVTVDYYFNSTEGYYLALFFLPMTIILTGLLLRHIPTPIPEAEPATRQSFHIWQIIFCTVGVFCFWVISQAHSGFIPTWTFLDKIPHHDQFILWLLGIGLTALGITGGLPLRRARQIIGHWLSESDTRWLLLIILIGFFVRIISLGTAIPNYIDEANFAKGVTNLRHYPNLNIMRQMDAIANFTWIYTYWQYLYTELFGANMANLRAVSAIVGTLTIPAVYLLGRWGFTRRIGLLAAFLLAIDLPHIHFSRLAMNNIVDPLFGVLAIAFMWRGLQTRSWQFMAWGGAFLGMTSYFYEGGRLLYPALIVGWLLVYLVVNKGHIYKRGILIFCIAIGLISSGFYLFLIQVNTQSTIPRLASERITNEYWYVILTAPNPIAKYIEERLTPPYLHIVSQPDGSRFYYSPHDAIVLPYLLPFLFIGIGVVLFDWRRLGLLFPLWIMLTIAGNSLIWSNDWTPRFVVVFPALVLLIAVGLDHIYRSVGWSWRGQASYRQKSYRITLAVMIILGLFQIGYYFAVLLPTYNIAYRTSADMQDATGRAQTLSPDTEVYILLMKHEFHAYIRDLQEFEKHAVQVKIVQSDAFDFQTVKDNPNQPFAFFIEQDDLDTYVSLLYLFGDDLKGPELSPYNVPEKYQYALYTVNQ